MLGRSSLAIGALLLAGLSVPVPAAQVRAVNQAAPQRGRAILPVFSGRTGGASGRRRAGLGWSNRHAQRVAAKKRNVVRHRVRSRGRA